MTIKRLVGHLHALLWLRLCCSKAELKYVQTEIDMIKADAAAVKLIIQAIVDKINTLTPVSAPHTICGCLR